MGENSILYVLIGLATLAGLWLFGRDARAIKGVLQTLQKDIGGAVEGGLLTYPVLEFRMQGLRARLGAEVGSSGADGGGGQHYTFCSVYFDQDPGRIFSYSLSRREFEQDRQLDAATRRLIDASVIGALQPIGSRHHAEIRCQSLDAAGWRLSIFVDEVLDGREDYLALLAAMQRMVHRWPLAMSAAPP